MSNADSTSFPAGQAPRAVGAGQSRHRLLLGSCVLGAGLLAGCVNVDESVSARPSELWRAPKEASRRVDGDGSGSVPARGVYLDGKGQQGGVSSAAAAIGMEPLELTTLVDIALENNPSTRISWHHARAAAAALGQSQSSFYPSATLGADITRLHTRNLSTLGSANTTRYGPSLSINWLLFSFGARTAAADSARETLYAANYNFNQTYQQVVRDVVVAYYNLYAAEATLEASRAYLANSEATATTAQKKLESGLGNRQDYLRAKAGVSTARAQLEGDKANIESARANLAAVLGIVVSENLNIVSPLQLGAQSTQKVDGDVNRLIAEAIENKPELLAAQAQVRASEADVRAARAALWPQISVGATGSYYRFWGGDYLANPQEQYGAGLIFNWDIFQGFNKRYAITRAEEGLRAGRESLRQSELQAVSLVWSSYYAYRSALRQLDATADAVKAQEEAYEAIKKGYESGINSLLDILTSEQNLDDAREQAISARANLGISLANLALATGTLAQD